MILRRLFFSALAFASVLVPSFAASADEAPAPSPSTINVDVGTFKNEKGFLGCRLFSSSAGFPQGSNGATQQRVAITGKVTRCTFANLAPGTYAVAVIHDENGNGKLDTNFLGAPTEGYGVSNNHTYALSAPKWDESKFAVEKSKTVHVGIALRY